MSLSLDRVNSSPLFNEEFSFEFRQWISNTVDTLNEVIGDIESALDVFIAPNYTAAEIATLLANGDLTNGIILYDTTNNVYVGMKSSSLVKFSTTSYP